MRATHPNLLNLPLLAAALIALNPLTAAAADLVFADGWTWTDVEIVPIPHPISSQRAAVPFEIAHQAPNVRRNSTV